jgi:hypothetical protein
MLFLLCLLLFSLAFTPYSRSANYALLSVRLGLIAVLSVLTLRERWKYRHDPHGPGAQANPDAGDTFLLRWRRWYFDEEH